MEEPELYELSGWIYDQHDFWWHDDGQQPHLCNVNHWPEDPLGKELFPPYDLGYLIRKLPEIRLETWHNGHIVIKHYTDTGVPSKLERLGKIIKAEADTPEDAACRLACELFKQNVLKKDTA